MRHAPRERRRWHRHAPPTTPRNRQIDRNAVSLAVNPRQRRGGQAIVRHAPRERRRWHRHAPPTTPRNRQIDRNAVSLAVNPRQRRGGQAIVRHAPRERRRWHRHAPTHLHFRRRFGKENRASSFLSTHLALSFQKIGCDSETQNQINLFCASLILHYLCSYFHF